MIPQHAGPGTPTIFVLRPRFAESRTNPRGQRHRIPDVTHDVTTTRSGATATVTAAAVGVLCGGLTLIVADLVASLTGRPSASPVLAVGSTFVDLTPSWLKDFAIRTFGEHDKQVLLGGMGL